MLASTLLISPGPKPVTVLLCFGRVKLAGPTGPLRSASGALIEGRRSRAGEASVAMVSRTRGLGSGEQRAERVCVCGECEYEKRGEEEEGQEVEVKVKAGAGRRGGDEGGGGCNEEKETRTSLYGQAVWSFTAVPKG